MEELEVVCPKCEAILRTASIPMTLQDSQIHPNCNEEQQLLYVQDAMRS